MKFALKWLLPLLIVQGLAACGSPSPQAEQSTDAANSASTLSAYHWQLRQALDASNTASTGWAVPNHQAVQIDFSNGRLAVSQLCNAMSASYSIDGPKMEVSRPMATMMACANPALMALESRVGARLPEIQRWAVQPPARASAAPQLTLIFSDGGRWLLDGTPTNETRYGGAGEKMFLEVAPERVACSHPLMPDSKCLKVRSLSYNEQGLKQSVGPWENFYSDIQGYTHEEGVRNVLRLKRYTRANPPADASKFVYVLDMTVETERRR